MTLTLDLLCVGRSLMDLYSNDIGAPFSEIRSFNAYLGGSPSNVAVGARRLGLRVGMLTAVAPDPVGDFVLRQFEKEQVETGWASKKQGRRTSAAVVAIEPPDRFPLVYYRDNCADAELSIDDVLAAPVASSRAVLFAGTNFSRESSRDACLYAAEVAKSAGAKVILVLDLRADQWRDIRAYGVNMRAMLPLVDLVIGTTSEVKAAAAKGSATAQVEHSQVSEARVGGDLDDAIAALLSYNLEALVLTRGGDGASVYQPGREPVHAAPFPVTILNTLGAGDAFSAGLLYGYLNGWDWERAARFGNACGAIVVTRHGCSQFMPTLPEVHELMHAAGATAAG